MVVFAEVADAIKRKVFIIGSDLKGSSMRVLTQREIESQAAILRL